MTVATEPKFDARGLTAALALIRGSQPLDEVREVVTYINGDIERQVTLELGPTFMRNVVEKTVGSFRLPVLIATPRKGKLRSISDLRNAAGEELTLLSHDDHQFVAKALLTMLLYKAYQPWLEDESGARDILIAKQALLFECVTLHADAAEEVFKSLFTSDGHLDGATQTKCVPALVHDLKQTAELLCTRYLLLADFVSADEGRNSLTYKHRRAYNERRERLMDKAKTFVGGRPSYVRVECPWARRTDSFHITYQVADGHYALRRFATHRPKAVTGRQHVKHLTRLPDRSAAGSSPQLVTCQPSPSISAPHLLVGRGTHSTEAIDAVFLTQERPLGSAGATWLTCFLTTALASLLSLFGFLIPLAQVTSPAVILALIAAIGTFSNSSFRTGDDGVSVLSKALVFFNVVLAISFCWVWVVLQSRSSTKEAADIQSINGWLSVGLVAALFLVLIFATVRVCNAVLNFQKVITHDD
ncbi:hypothetical protein [Aeromicrobium sp. 9AM]|uniref:hypothetical protein n=1 Tax=Aeromicrobium sp. 9AM TaxID=2653126 RepID=UPI0012EF3FAC|nr:hypothetical protein [Aeromicrobium sp. 9AM]VXB03336.1 membrane hypothetical protein [Aeromicrobium sp. 9AM]